MNEDRLFAKYKGEKIALYGLGVETKKALDNLTGNYEIVGLMDSFREEGELYGQAILSFDHVVRAGAKLIIVVARPGSCRAIAHKIGNQCRKTGIALMDIRGGDLLEVKNVSYNFNGIGGITKRELKEKIRSADIVSFDLFDTLVMRQILSSDDVIEYVDCKLKEQESYIKDFCKRRLESEKGLSRETAPTLTEIYQNMLSSEEDNSAINITPEKLADLEWNIDLGLLVARKEVCDLFRETVKSGKKVYIVSDTYYSKRQLERILVLCGIEEYEDILDSSEYGTDKRRGLYGVLKDREGDKKYLHIGDDLAADIEAAKYWEINACRILSGADILESLGNLGFSEHIECLADRLKAGMFVAKIFNSPFQFEKEDRRLELKDAYDIGYLLCAPVISDFVLWFQKQLEKEGIQNIWFGARDGYLIKKMYANLMQAYHKTDESMYFLTSRTAAIRAGVESEEDIRYVDEMKYSGTLEENLYERFGIEAAHISNEDVLDSAAGLLKYKDVILQNAHMQSANYKKYILRLNGREGKIAFFDFVAKGTTQMYIQRLVDYPIKGFYFLQLEADYMKNKKLEICSFGEAENAVNNGVQDAVFENYYILETLLTAPHSSVSGFDENGQPIYALESRKDSALCCIERAQEGILDYFKSYLKLCPETARHINRELDGIFLKLVHEMLIADKHFLELVVEDPFFNRMTKITDVL